MPNVRETSPGVFEELAPGQSIKVVRNGLPDVYFSATVANVWTDAELAAIGIYRVPPAVVPPNQRSTGMRYERQGDKVVQVLDLVPIVPTSITRRQMILALFTYGMITGPEAVAAAKSGDLPAFVANYFNQLPEADRVAAEVTWASMSTCERNNPILLAMAQITGLTPAQMDQYFIQASQL
jgi:hypothetical protein